MKKLKFYFLVIFTFIANMSVFTQDITFVPRDTLIQGNIGDEMIFYIDVKNISSVEQTVFVLRTINDLPLEWYSALCLDVCFSSEVDSVATTPDFGSSPLDPGETRELSLYATAVNNDGTAYVQLQAGTFNNPIDRIIVNFTATTLPSSIERDGSHLSEYYISQNYPNPFNPSTQINYNIAESGFVNLKVYNILGMEVATLVNEYKSAGNYHVSFDGNDLSSGVYIYNLSVNDFTNTRKMILEK